MKTQNMVLVGGAILGAVLLLPKFLQKIGVTAAAPTAPLSPATWITTGPSSLPGALGIPYTGDMGAITIPPPTGGQAARHATDTLNNPAGSAAGIAEQATLDAQLYTQQKAASGQRVSLPVSTNQGSQAPIPALFVEGSGASAHLGEAYVRPAMHYGLTGAQIAAGIGEADFSIPAGTWFEPDPEIIKAIMKGGTPPAYPDMTPHEAYLADIAFMRNHGGATVFEYYGQGYRTGCDQSGWEWGGSITPSIEPVIDTAPQHAANIRAAADAAAAGLLAVHGDYDRLSEPQKLALRQGLALGYDPVGGTAAPIVSSPAPAPTEPADSTYDPGAPLDEYGHYGGYVPPPAPEPITLQAFRAWEEAYTEPAPTPTPPPTPSPPPPPAPTYHSPATGEDYSYDDLFGSAAGGWSGVGM